MFTSLSLVYIFFPLFLFPASISAEYYSSIADIGQIYDIGRQLGEDLNTYLELEEARLDELRRVTKRLSNNKDKINITADSEEYLGNPINAYLTVRRLALDDKLKLLSLLDTGGNDGESSEHIGAPESPIKQHLTEVKARVEYGMNLLPGDADVDGAAEALLLLQDTYKLSAEELANGNIVDDIKAPKLSAAECMHLGQQAYDAREYLRAEEWFRTAYNRLHEELNDIIDGDESTSSDPEADASRPDRMRILDHLAYALGRQGRYEEAMNITKLIIEDDPKNLHALDNERFYRERIRLGEGRLGPAPRDPPRTNSEKETEIYQAVCRGEELFLKPPDDSVYCQYKVPHAYYTLHPVKEEVLYPDPKVVMWHDVIQTDEIEKIKQLATPRLRRATVKNPQTGKLEFAAYRTSKSAWLPDDMDEITHRMNKRIHFLTGLDMETAEDLQVGNYGIGGYYAPHFDFGRKRELDAFEKAHGNRIATIIFYLSDVPAGGATVFNRVGATVAPKRGAASFWYNLFPSGHGDLRTRHVACPVLVGSKWVMNVWFHERGQELVRPCGLEEGPIEIDDGY